MAASGLHLELGTVLYQWNDLAAADAHIRRAVELDELGEAWGRLHTYRMLAYLHYAEGDYESPFSAWRKPAPFVSRSASTNSTSPAEPSLDQLQSCSPVLGPR